MSGLLTPVGMRGAREGFASPSVGLGGWSYGAEPGAMPVEARDRDAMARSGDAPSVPLGRRVSRALTVALSITGAAAGGISSSATSRARPGTPRPMSLRSPAWAQSPEPRLARLSVRPSVRSRGR